MAQQVRGPYFDELRTGDVFDSAPAVTLTSGLQAAHDAVVGNRLRILRDHRLAYAVAHRRRLASPSLVTDLSIGHSTIATQNVRANVFYRGLHLQRLPALGDTLRTTTTVAGLRRNSTRPDRAPTGLAALHIVTVDQDDRPVLDFWRGAMLPVSPGGPDDGPREDLDAIGRARRDSPAASVSGWDLAAFRSAAPGTHFSDLSVSQTWEVGGADVVSSAPELARLTGNVAAVHHHAAAAGGRRLVYGGHTIGLAFHQVTRALPNVVTVAGWESCDHLAPVHEDDALTSTISVEDLAPFGDGGGLACLRVAVEAVPSSASAGAPATRVLDWRVGVVLA